MRERRPAPQVARDYDVLVLDRTLPDGSGDDLCRRVVDSGASTKVLMLTARDAVAERVAGLELGADDYVTKPVAMAERERAVNARGGVLRWVRNATGVSLQRVRVHGRGGACRGAT